MTTIQDRIEKLVKDILQCGFCVAMGGDVFKSEEENKKLQEEKYNECVAVFSHKIITSIKEVEEETKGDVLNKLHAMVCDLATDKGKDLAKEDCLELIRYQIERIYGKKLLSITNKEKQK